MAPRKAAPVALARDPAGPLLWVTEWMNSCPFDAAQMESRTAFVRAVLREPPQRHPAAVWAARWTAWQRQVP